MQILYRVIVFVLGVFGALEALFINIIYSSSTRFQNLVGLSPDASHGFIGLGLVLLGILGAILVLFRALIPGAVLLLIAGVGFFFIVHWWALLASPQMLLAAFLAFYHYWERQGKGTTRPREEQPRGGAVA